MAADDPRLEDAAPPPLSPQRSTSQRKFSRNIQPFPHNFAHVVPSHDVAPPPVHLIAQALLRAGADIHCSVGFGTPTPVQLARQLLAVRAARPPLPYVSAAQEAHQGLVEADPVEGAMESAVEVTVEADLCRCSESEAAFCNCKSSGRRREEGSAAAELVLRAAEPWSPSNHALFPRKVAPTLCTASAWALHGLPLHARLTQLPCAHATTFIISIAKTKWQLPGTS